MLYQMRGIYKNKMAQEITEEIKEEIKKTFWTDDEGNKQISLSNSRLDFKKDYFVIGFTKKGLKLYWLNGLNKVFVIAKVAYNSEYKDFSLYTESWNYIERLKINEVKE